MSSIPKIMVKFFSKYSNLCDHGTGTSQTDGRTDGQTTYCGIINRALYSVERSTYAR